MIRILAIGAVIAGMCCALPANAQLGGQARFLF